MSMRMPIITGCDVLECSYNANAQCHAKAITVGDQRHPACDTFTNSKAKGGESDDQGGVGACKTSDCSYNNRLECSAPGIKVGHHGDHADCATFRPRSVSP